MACDSIRAQLLLSLVNLSAAPWHIYALHTEPEQTWSVNVNERAHLDVEEMRNQEADRLVCVHALKLLKRATEAAAKVDKNRFGRGRGRGK